MLTAGDDPLYIARHLIVMASEDVGLANNHALLPFVSQTATFYHDPFFSKLKSTKLNRLLLHL